MKEGQTGKAGKAGVLLAVALGLASSGSCGCGGAAPPTLQREALLDPANCQSCHPRQFADWSGSMHAYASDDPVFLAMNQRAQRETKGALGDFCVKCHAPVAVSEGLTTDGHDLPQLPAAYKGITCYFCHAATAVTGTHNNPVELAKDNRLFGPFGDAAPGTPHSALYSALMDSSRAESAAFCGSCHDIVNQHGASVERTFEEWQGTIFADAKTGNGNTCSDCHMTPSPDGPAPASNVSTRLRDLHSHALPGVDVALTAAPELAAQRAGVQAQLDTVMQSAICFDQRTMKIWVVLDNAASGHGFPSGATPDRRAWVEVEAFSAGAPIYRSGVAQGDAAAGALPKGGAADPDLWLLRDCLYDEAGKPASMFWDAATVTSNALPGTVALLVTDPSTFTKTHIKAIYPGGSTALSVLPDRITVKVHVKPIGDDVLADLVASGDLDATVAARVPTFDMGNGGVLEWTPATAKQPPRLDPTQQVTCVVAGGGSYTDTPNLAVSHAQCPATP